MRHEQKYKTSYPSHRIHSNEKPKDLKEQRNLILHKNRNKYFYHENESILDEHIVGDDDLKRDRYTV